VLGLKGTMSEAELHVLRARSRGGSLHKADEGELRLPLPAGYEYDEQGAVRTTPDEAVADAIASGRVLTIPARDACVPIPRRYQLAVR